MRTNIASNKKRTPTLIPRDAYFRVWGFMRSELGLEKTELMVYALIYSYFRSATSFTASRDYISEWVGSGKSAVDVALASLLKKGYITKAQRCYRGMHYIEYNVNVDALPMTSEHFDIINMHREEKLKCRDM